MRVEKTVVKALQVLEALARSEQPRGVSELARELGFSKSNMYRLLDTLREASYVNRVAGGTAFELSLKMWHLGSRVTARLTVLHGDQGICIEQVETTLPMRIQTPIGGSLLLYCSATGKAMLAFQSSAFIDSIAASIEKFTPASIATRRDLIAELTQIR